MSTFKVGDKVRCIKSYRGHVTAGCTYTVHDVTGGMYIHVDTGDRLIGIGGYAAERFELVAEEPEYLTPEQVFEYLKNKIPLEYKYEYTTAQGDTVEGWRECGNPQFANILNRVWRSKPVPKTIDYYGTELPKQVDLSTLAPDTTVYRALFQNGVVLSVKVDRALLSNGIHFATAEDAKKVLDVLRKPFQ